MEPGLSEILSGKNGVDVHKGVIHPNMSILPSGHIPPNPSELISSRRMETLLEGFKAEYDYIIMDLPPVLAVSDPVAVAKYLGGMIIVVRHANTRRRDIVETISFHSADKLIKFCKGIQMGSPVEAYCIPEPGDMPGYPHPEIMAAGTFITGATNELSCDGPIVEPYTAYMQGGLTYEYGKLGIMKAIDTMLG